MTRGKGTYSPLSELTLEMVHTEFMHINGRNRFILLGAPLSTVVTGITLDAIPL